MATTVSEEIAMLPDVRQFLELLPPGTPVFDGYEGQWQELQPQWQELLPDRFFDDHFVVFTHVSEHALDSTNDRLPGLVDYSPVLELLIFKMPSLVHEEAVRLFEGRLQIIANEMHVHRRLSYRGSSNVRAIDRTKQADATYAPRGQSRKWPTLAVEVGCSETTAKLHGDMKFWINKSNGEVKRGITIDIKKSGTIIISSWVPDYTPVRTTTTTSGRHSAPSSELLPPPRKTDTITIKRGVRGQSHVIEGGDLVIPFRDLLLSDPGHAEHDFVFGKEFLLNDLAIRVWDAIEQGGPLVGK